VGGKERRHGLDLTFTRNLQQQIDRELDRLYPSRSGQGIARRGAEKVERITSAC
jgi:hypothetical protein